MQLPTISDPDSALSEGEAAGNSRLPARSAWLLYTLIVLEILFMVSPFAGYYYSIYALPLNVLQRSEHSAWLTMYLLPHFAYSDSWLVNGLILISWPLILFGLVLFVLGFCQVYWSKVTRRGAVEVGLYRYIRHPQYIALAVIGLGTSLYWSRFIVVITYVGMLGIYYFLARTEERNCLARFGVSYRDYMSRTGMFWPQSWERRWRKIGLRLPPSGWPRSALLGGFYAGLLALTIGTAHGLRRHSIDSLQLEVGPARVFVFLAPISPLARTEVTNLLNTTESTGDIVYVAPSSWQIPELGFAGDGKRYEHSYSDELLHPTTHGNSLSFEENRLTALVARATTSNKATGLERFTQALAVQPLEFAQLNLLDGTIAGRKPATPGQWVGVPVPTF